MTYITLNDIKSRIDPAKLIQLTDDGETGEINTTVVDEIIADAEGTFESYARTRYTLPVPLTAKVKSICLDLAVFKLYERRPSEGPVFSAREKAYDKAIKFLEAIQAGKAALDVPAAEETKANPTSSDQVLKGSSRPSPFSDEKLRGY